MKYVAALLAVAAALVAVASAQCVTPDCDQDVLKVYTLSQIDYGISEDFSFGSNTNTNTAGRKANRAAPARPAKLKGPQGAAAATAPAPAAATAPVAAAATAPVAAAVPAAPAAAPVTSASESGATQAGNATLFNTNTAQLPAGINAFPTDSCQSFFNILSAFSYYDYNANEGFLSDYHLPCLGRISTINFVYEDTRKHSATFEIKSSVDGVAPLVWQDNNNNYYNSYNTGARAQYSINTASSLPHPYVTPFSKVGIDSFIMNGIKFNVNQRTVLTPAVFDAASAANNANGYGGGGCARIRHHSFYVEGKGDNGDGGVELFYIEVVVQETTVPY